MKTVELNNFIPFPGNYFSHFFIGVEEMDQNENVLLKFSGIQNLAVKAKVIQQVQLDGDLKVQFHALRAFEIGENGEMRPMSVTCEANGVSTSETNEFKELLKRWDPMEYGTSPNHYFELIEKAKDKRRLLELVGGGICRPQKFPFNSSKGMKNAVKERAEILALSTCEEQIDRIRDLIMTEAAQ